MLSGTTFSTYSRLERFTVWKLLPENCGDWVEHVVSTTGVAGVVLLCVGVGLLVLAALGVVLF